MGYSVYNLNKKIFAGYGVPAYCNHPDCNEEIDRGMPYACGGEPFSELGCDKYFCTKHLHYTGFKRDGTDERCDHEEDCECEFVEVCERCADVSELEFDRKPEHPTWVKHVLTHGSWQKWRHENPDLVEEYKQMLELSKK